jgi:hypothetical protein
MIAYLMVLGVLVVEVEVEVDIEGGKEDEAEVVIKRKLGSVGWLLN